MRFMKQLFSLALLTTLVSAATYAEEKVESQPAIDQKDQRGWGKFVSFKDGALTLKSNDGRLLVWHGLGKETKAMVYHTEAGKHLQADNTLVALSQTKPGTWVHVREKRADIYVGAKKGQVSGTFVSFKEGRLLLLGKDLGDNSYTRKYGNNLQYNKFAADVPVHESVDGGEYKLIGTANEILKDIKEGTLLTVHGEGDDNITLIQIGLPKKN